MHTKPATDSEFDAHANGLSRPLQLDKLVQRARLWDFGVPSSSRGPSWFRNPSLFGTLNPDSFFNYTFVRRTIDAVIPPARYIRAGNTTGGIQVVIAFKKQVQESSCRQEVLQLLAADALSNYPVVVLLKG